MKKLNVLFLNIAFLYTALFANETIYSDAKNVVKMIEKEEVKYIVAEHSTVKIRGSYEFDTKYLYEGTILGQMPCEPLYSCPRKVEQYLSKMGIENKTALIIYDDSYGIYAATLYTLLESLGHQNITILNGGSKSISDIDPNQITYDKYYKELESLLVTSSKDEKKELHEELKEKQESLEEKLEILAPHLLVVENKHQELNTSKTQYKIAKENINLDYLLTKSELENVVQTLRVQKEDLNISIIDACPMVDIVGNTKGSYVSLVKPLSWKDMIDVESGGLKEKSLLGKIFQKAGLKKEDNNYVYCMSGSPKALFVLTALRELGYKDTKAFTGDWNVWVGDVNE